MKYANFYVLCINLILNFSIFLILPKKLLIHVLATSLIVLIR